MDATHDLALKKRQHILKAHPFFILLSEHDLMELAKLTQVIEIAEKQVVVKEGDLIDSIYLIVKGEAEVTRQIVTLDKKANIPVAVLYPGEAIGLSSEGLFSKHGQRAATVTALMKLTLLKLQLNEFTTFMQTTCLYPGFEKQVENILKLDLIKQASPFMRLPMDEAVHLVDKITSTQVSAGDFIFHQEDFADKVYLIQSGCVEVLKTTDKGSTSTIAVLHTPEIFGEVAFLSGGRRSATVRALEKCQLMSIEYQALLKIIKLEPKIENDLRGTADERRIPVKKYEAMVLLNTLDNEAIITLKNEQHHLYCQLPQAGESVWHLINGKNSIAQIIKLCAQTYGSDVNSMVYGMLSNLVRGGFVTLPKTSFKKRGSFWKDLWRFR